MADDYMTGNDYLRFITGIHFTKSMLKTLYGVTFIYNPNWTSKNSDNATFPVAFFHVKKCEEVMESEVSTKPMLFYNSNRAYNTLATNGALINIVADNIIAKPKVYKLDVIIPYNDLTLLNSTTIMNATQLEGVTAMLMNYNDGYTNSYSPVKYLSLATPYVNIIKSILRLLVADYDSTDFVSSVLKTPDYNKNSLEAMWQTRGILKMKMWNGWNYKYVAITNMNIIKEGTEDGVYEATLTLQELPILTVRGNNGSLVAGYKNPIVEASGKTLITALNKLEGKL